MTFAYSKITIISDNPFLIRAFHKACADKNIQLPVAYYCSPVNKALLNDTTMPVVVKAIDIKKDWAQIVDKDTIVFSLHCKQLFPAELVRSVKCINVHPGFNPYNRGWYPQVFSILNKEKVGATIHEIDEELDHGPIICRREVGIDAWDTSLDVYNKIQLAEEVLLQEWLEKILANSYTAFLPETEGNVNYKKDFNDLRQVDPDRKMTLREAIDYFRAMTHGEFNNLYFVDNLTGEKVYVRIKLQRDGSSEKHGK